MNHNKNTRILLVLIIALLITGLTAGLLFFAKERKEYKVNYEESVVKYNEVEQYNRVLEKGIHSVIHNEYNDALNYFKIADSLATNNQYYNQFNEFISGINVKSDSLSLLRRQAKSLLFFNKNQQNQISNLKLKIQHTEKVVDSLDDSYTNAISQLNRIATELDNAITQLVEKSSENIERTETIDKLRNNFGEISFKTKTGVLINYIGELDEGKAKGYGVGFYDTGSHYIGYWKDNQRDGQGKYYWKNGDYFVGQFYNDKKQGFGIYYFISGERYEGNWYNDLREGYGEMISDKDKLLVKGTWKEDKIISNENKTAIQK